ncbi:MAG TPA: hypothetical protein VF167_03480 [Longimicrobiaceae bacterium]
MKVPIEWLVQRVDEPPTSYNPREGSSPLRIRMAWQKLKSRAHGQDEIWAYANPSDRHGRHQGFALVREGVVIEAIEVD